MAEVLHYDIGRSPRKPHRDRDFLGTCFAFGSPRFFVTAAHCLDGFTADELSVCQTARTGASLVRVNEVQHHPTADLAVLSLASPFNGLTPFARSIGTPGLGLDFWAYGFPEDVFGPHARQPVPRVFRGHFQRGLRHESHLGYSYDAVELSITAPAGLSGGPLFYAHEPHVVLAVVSENLESMTLLHSAEETAKDGVIVRDHFHKVIQYGIAVDLRPLQRWLTDCTRA